MAKLIEIPMSEAEAQRLEPVRFATHCRRRGPRRGQVRLPDGTLMGLGELEKRLDRAGRDLGHALAFYRSAYGVLASAVQRGDLSLEQARVVIGGLEPHIREIVERLRKYPSAQAEIEAAERRFEQGVGVLFFGVPVILWVIGLGSLGVLAISESIKPMFVSSRATTYQKIVDATGQPDLAARLTAEAYEGSGPGGLTGLGEDALGLVKNLAFAGLFGWFFLKILAPRLAKGATKMGEKLGDWGDSLQERGEKSIAKQRSVLS